ncbi:hypothetical protein [Candidatus Sororendozoicomonas aggregata]|uniref:hypothetical protein n=1 Tax=Candidatus Sororendozoicomonas aggregata TaxID=3073239 RepID=UPI003B75CC79
MSKQFDDRAGTLVVFNGNKSTLSKVEFVFVKGCYMDEPFANATDEIPGASVQVAKRSELHTFAVISQRWVIERSLSLTGNCRRLWKNTGRKLSTGLQQTIKQTSMTDSKLKVYQQSSLTLAPLSQSRLLIILCRIKA